MIRVRWVARDSGTIRDFPDNQLDKALECANMYVRFPDAPSHVHDCLERYGRYAALGPTGWVEVFKPMSL
jgi:hypothetical protein